MKTLPIIVHLLLMGCAVIGGCKMALDVPTSEQVSRIVVSYNCLQGQEEWAKAPPDRVIDDSRQIARITSFLASHNRGWHKPWDTFPNGSYYIFFYKDQECVLSLAVDPDDWIGGLVGGEQRLRRFSRKESDQIYQLLGIDYEYGP